MGMVVGLDWKTMEFSISRWGSQKHIRYVSWDEIFLFFEGDNIGIWKSYLMNSVHIQYKYPLVI